MEEKIKDIKEMREAILNSPRQLSQGANFAAKVKPKKANYDKVIICGMGGSALPGNILIEYLAPEIKIPIYIHRSYNLPAYADKKSLVICISYSGNTEETISACRQAIKQKIPAAGISFDGKLEKIAQQNKIPLAKIGGEKIQPRQATGYIFSALVKILANANIIKDKTEEINRAAKKIEAEKMEKQGKALAKKINKKIPLVYASENHKALARIWKIKFNENAKTMAFWNYFPELNHNEMVGFENAGKIKNNFYALILRDKKDHPRILKRMDLLTKIIKERKINISFVEINGRTELEKIFNSLVLSDWTSYYLALNYKIDPVPVNIVEKFKKLMAK